jgi:hypothetical protein
MHALLLEIICAEKHCHQYWMFLVLCTRLTDGSILYLLYKLMNDEDEFCKYFGMSVKTFGET